MLFWINMSSIQLIALLRSKRSSAFLQMSKTDELKKCQLKENLATLIKNQTSKNTVIVYDQPITRWAAVLGQILTAKPTCQSSGVTAYC